ncbi:MAG TPA: inositol monophosphatase family protein [Mycobacteriales bacterium]
MSHELLALAVTVAHEAGALLRDGRESMSSDIDTKSSPTDVVTALDRASERLIAGRLLDARPDDGLLGEEGAARPGTSGVRWVIDPVDGTVNFLYRLPSWAVSIGCEADGEVVAGVVYDVPRDVTWTAVRGRGAFRNGAPVTCSTVDTLAGALVATGFSYESARRARQATIVADLLPRVRDIRRLGSAALDLCSAAAGHVDAYYEQGAYPWDLAAGGLIAAEAGCRVEGLHGAPAGRPLTIAAPPALFDLLHAALARHAEPLALESWAEDVS